MPRGDRTGPSGQGPRTGRGLGNCPPNTKKKKPTETPLPPRRGGGRGTIRGRNRGRGRNR